MEDKYKREKLRIIVQLLFADKKITDLIIIFNTVVLYTVQCTRTRTHTHNLNPRQNKTNNSLKRVYLTIKNENNSRIVTSVIIKHDIS